LRKSAGIPNIRTRQKKNFFLGGLIYSWVRWSPRWLDPLFSLQGTQNLFFFFFRRAKTANCRVFTRPFMETREGFWKKRGWSRVWRGPFQTPSRGPTASPFREKKKKKTLAKTNSGVSFFPPPNPRAFIFPVKPNYFSFFFFFFSSRVIEDLFFWRGPPKKKVENQKFGQGIIPALRAGFPILESMADFPFYVLLGAWLALI